MLWMTVVGSIEQSIYFSIYVDNSNSLLSKSAVRLARAGSGHHVITDHLLSTLQAIMVRREAYIHPTRQTELWHTGLLLLSSLTCPTILFSCARSLCANYFRNTHSQRIRYTFMHATQRRTTCTRSLPLNISCRLQPAPILWTTMNTTNYLSRHTTTTRFPLHSNNFISTFPTKVAIRHGSICLMICANVTRMLMYAWTHSNSSQTLLVFNHPLPSSSRIRRKNWFGSSAIIVYKRKPQSNEGITPTCV